MSYLYWLAGVLVDFPVGSFSKIGKEKFRLVPPEGNIDKSHQKL
jgi:hypothetical protein